MSKGDLPPEASSAFPISPFVGKCLIVAAWLFVLANVAFVFLSVMLLRAPPS